MACSHGVEANVNTRLTCLCAVEERSCPVLHRIDEVGSAMESMKQGEDDTEKVSHSGETLAAGICTGAA
jgi:hypothetical protein